MYSQHAAAQFEDAPEGPESRLIDSIMRRQASAALLQQSLLTQRMAMTQMVAPPNAAVAAAAVMPPPAEAPEKPPAVVRAPLPLHQMLLPRATAAAPSTAAAAAPPTQAAADDSSVTTAESAESQQQPKEGSDQRLPKDVNDNDVLCGRGKGSNNFTGNRRFQELVRQHRPIYVSAKKRRNKRAVCEQIIGLVLSRGGRFLGKVQCDSAPLQYKWEPLSYDKVLIKVSQALRETPKMSAKKIREMKFAEMGNMLVLADMASIAAPVRRDSKGNKIKQQPV